MLSSPKPAACRKRCIRLVFADGSVCDFKEAMSAGEALQLSLHTLAHIPDKSFNNFLVCDSASLRIAKRACPLHPDMQLELGHLYYVLPIRTYQHRLAWSYISALAAMATSPSSTTDPSLTLSSAARTQASSHNKSSPSTTKTSKRSAVSRPFVRILDAKLFLRFLLRHVLLSNCKGKSRVSDAHIACDDRTGATSHLAVDTEGRREEEAAGLRSKGRESRWEFNNICGSPAVNGKYVELLIERSNSWRPPLLPIQESLAV